MPFEVFEDASGGFRWRLKATNGEVVAQSERYSTKSNAQRGADDARSAALQSEVKETPSQN